MKVASLIILLTSTLLFSQKQYKDTVSINKALKIEILKVDDTLDKISLLNNIISNSKKISFDKGTYSATYKLANLKNAKYGQDSMISVFKRAIEYTNPKSQNYGLYLSNLQDTYQRMNKNDSSLFYNSRLHEHQKTVADPSHRATLNISLGNYWFNKYEYNKSYIYYARVDSICNTAKHLKYSNIHGSALHYLGYAIRTIKGYPDAIAYYEKAKEIYENNDNEKSLQEVNIALGQAYANTGKYDQAITLLDRAVTYAAKFGTENDESYSVIVRGYTYVKMNLFDKAEPDYKKYYELATETKDEVKVRRALGYLGFFYFQKGDYQTALTYYNEAIEKSIETEDDGKLNELYPEVIAIYKETNNLNALAKTYDAYISNIKKIEEKNIVKQTIALDAKYQTEKKEQAIALLTSQKQVAAQRNKNQQTLYMSVIAITGISGFFFFFLFRNRQKTNEKLKNLDKAKSTFFANISHEFRTPITLIKGPLEDQLRDENLTGVKRKNLLGAKRNSERLEALVEQLMALSKLESSTMQLQVQPGNLSNFIGIQAEAFKYKAKDEGLDFSMDLEKIKEPSWFDREILEKICSNLLGNALKYTSPNGSIQVEGNLQNGNYVLIVSNTNNSLSEEEMKYIFTRFYQTKNTNTGMGIGLALTKELTELHKGRISVTKKQNDLIEFKTVLPVSKNSFSSNEILSETLTSKREYGIDSEEIKLPTPTEITEETPLVLIVDDSKEVRDYVASLFTDTYQVKTAANGKEGYIFAQEMVPDIIISDVLMPVEDGIIFTKNSKKNPLTEHIPIILLSAKTEVEDKLAGLDVGADAYIAKPFSPQLLLGTVENLLNNRRKLQERFAREVILKPAKISISTAEEEFLLKLQTVIDEKLADPDFSVTQFGETMGMSRMQLHRKLKAVSGQSTSEFLRTQRLLAATQLLKNKKLSISEIGYAVGFNDPSYFTRCFKEDFGVSPTEYSKKYS